MKTHTQTQSTRDGKRGRENKKRKMKRLTSMIKHFHVAKISYNFFLSSFTYGEHVLSLFAGVLSVNTTATCNRITAKKKLKTKIQCKGNRAVCFLRLHFFYRKNVHSEHDKRWLYHSRQFDIASPATLRIPFCFITVIAYTPKTTEKCNEHNSPF